MSTEVETALRQMLRAVADNTEVPPVPQPDSATATAGRRDRLGRRMTAVIAAGGIAVIGVGAAAATGALDPGANKAFAEWENVDPSTAFLIAKLPGPYGSQIAVYEASEQDNSNTCVAFRLIGDPAYSAPSVGGWCSTGSDDDRRTFGRWGGSVSQIEFPGRENFAIFAFSSGSDTVKADLIYDDGEQAATIANGYVLGWLPESAWPTATLIGRNASGTVIGEIRNLGADQPQLVK